MLLKPITLPLANGDRLAGDYLAPATHPSFAVLWVHGFGSVRGGTKAVALASECARRGWAFAAFDFRGHGGSTGDIHGLRPARLQEELDAIASFLGDLGHAQLGLVGSSMGGFATAWFTRRHPDRAIGCVFLAPAFGFLERRWNRLTPAEREQWKRTDRLRITSDWVDVDVGYGLMDGREAFHLRNLAAGWGTPALLFHGLADDIVPIDDSLTFIRDVPFPQVELRLLKDGDHRLTAYKDEIAAEAGRFFARLLGETTDTVPGSEAQP